MATWIAHLRIAENLLELIPNLDAGQFAIGNIAPDAGIPDERLTEIGAALQPGTSVILAVVEQRWFEPVQMRLQEAGGDVLSETLNEEFIEQFETDREDSK